MSSHNDDMNEVMNFALNHAIESISSGEILVPFVVYKSHKEQLLKRFASPTVDESVDHARIDIKKNVKKGFSFALVYQGLISNGSKENKCIFVKYGVSSLKVQVFAQLFESGRFQRKPKLLGDPKYLGIHDSI